MVQEVVYLRKFLENLWFPQEKQTPVFADNETCDKWSEGAVGGSECAKHVDLRIHFVHDAVAAKYLKLIKIESKLNGADILTKPTKELIPRFRSASKSSDWLSVMDRTLQ